MLRAEHLIARGVGTGPVEVTLYDRPGVHIFINIDGRFFGTSDGASSPRQRRALAQRARVERVTAVAPDGSSFTVETASGSLTLIAAPSLLAGIEVGDRVVVTYTSNAGALTARSVRVAAIPASRPSGSGGGWSDGSQP